VFSVVCVHDLAWFGAIGMAFNRFSRSEGRKEPLHLVVDAKGLPRREQGAVNFWEAAYPFGSSSRASRAQKASPRNSCRKDQQTGADPRRYGAGPIPSRFRPRRRLSLQAPERQHRKKMHRCAEASNHNIWGFNTGRLWGPLPSF
jgi:hypothetical protein